MLGQRGTKRGGAPAAPEASPRLLLARKRMGDLGVSPSDLPCVREKRWQEKRQKLLGELGTQGLRPRQAFGVIQDIGRVGKSGIRTVGYFQPDDDPYGYFPLVKARMLQALKRWIANDWIKLLGCAPTRSGQGRL